MDEFLLYSIKMKWKTLIYKVSNLVAFIFSLNVENKRMPFDAHKV